MSGWDLAIVFASLVAWAALLEALGTLRLEPGDLDDLLFLAKSGDWIDSVVQTTANGYGTVLGHLVVLHLAIPDSAGTGATFEERAQSVVARMREALQVRCFQALVPVQALAALGLLFAYRSEVRWLCLAGLANAGLAVAAGLWTGLVWRRTSRLLADASRALVPLLRPLAELDPAQCLACKLARACCVSYAGLFGETWSQSAKPHSAKALEEASAADRPALAKQVEDALTRVRRVENRRKTDADRWFEQVAYLGLSQAVLLAANVVLGIRSVEPASLGGSTAMEQQLSLEFARLGANQVALSWSPTLLTEQMGFVSHFWLFVVAVGFAVVTAIAGLVLMLNELTWTRPLLWALAACATLTPTLRFRTEVDPGARVVRKLGCAAWGLGCWPRQVVPFDALAAPTVREEPPTEHEPTRYVLELATHDGQVAFSVSSRQGEDMAALRALTADLLSRRGRFAPPAEAPDPKGGP